MACTASCKCSSSWWCCIQVHKALRSTMLSSIPWCPRTRRRCTTAPKGSSSSLIRATASRSSPTCWTPQVLLPCSYNRPHALYTSCWTSHHITCVPCPPQNCGVVFILLLTHVAMSCEGCWVEPHPRYVRCGCSADSRCHCSGSNIALRHVRLGHMGRQRPPPPSCALFCCRGGQSVF